MNYFIDKFEAETVSEFLCNVESFIVTIEERIEEMEAEGVDEEIIETEYDYISELESEMLLYKGCATYDFVKGFKKQSDNTVEDIFRVIPFNKANLAEIKECIIEEYLYEDGEEAVAEFNKISTMKALRDWFKANDFLGRDYQIYNKMFVSCLTC